MAMDITKRQQLEQRLRDSPDLLAGIIASAIDAIIVTNDAQRIMLLNDAAERMFACSAALQNSTKHSGVRYLEVRLWGTSDEIHLTVRDSGAGFDREAAKKSRGLGLISMGERLRLVNGPLSIESQPKHGTTRLCPRSFQCGKRFGRRSRLSG